MMLMHVYACTFLHRKQQYPRIIHSLMDLLTMMWSDYSEPEDRQKTNTLKWIESMGVVMPCSKMIFLLNSNRPHSSPTRTMCKIMM